MSSLPIILFLVRIAARRLSLEIHPHENTLLIRTVRCSWARTPRICQHFHRYSLASGEGEDSFVSPTFLAHRCGIRRFVVEIRPTNNRCQLFGLWNTQKFDSVLLLETTILGSCCSPRAIYQLEWPSLFWAAGTGRGGGERSSLQFL